MASGDADEAQATPVAEAAESNSVPDPTQAPAKSPSLRSVPVQAAALFTEVPGLALFSAAAAMSHIQLRRVILPFWIGRGGLVPEWIMQTEPFVLALAFFATLVTHVWCISGFVQERAFAHPARRALMVMLSGVLISSVLIAGLVQALNPDIRIRLVLMAAGACHALTWQIAMGTVRFDHSLSGRTTAGLIAAAALFPLGGLLLRHWQVLAHTQLAHEGIAGLHGLGELAYLLVPVAGAFAVVPWDDGPSGVRARRVGAVVVFLCGVVFAAASRMPEGTYGDYLYATLRLEWALERASLGYTVPVSLAMGAATAAVVSSDARHRQGGAGLFLWLAGGYNPLSPSRLLLLSAAVALICRATVGLAADAAQQRTSTEAS